jgi:5-enolpyruvylshikimate-3-phosphate synthase
VQRGQLFIGNMPVEPWACAILHFLRRMGCTAGIQQEAQTSFGAAGVVSLQKFKLSGHKIDCKPLYLYQRQLPMMVVCAVFAQGQSVFRELEDLRNDIPDPIERLLACVRLLGGRHGEMPDGIVVDGAKQYDGFDANEPYPASVNGTLAIAGLKCTGISAIEESDILRRWPSFATLLDTVCHYGT